MKAFEEIIAERDRTEKDIDKLEREIEDLKVRAERRLEEMQKLSLKLSEYDFIIEHLKPMFKEDEA